MIKIAGLVYKMKEKINIYRDITVFNDLQDAKKMVEN